MPDTKTKKDPSYADSEVADDVRHKPSSHEAWLSRYVWDTLDKDPKERWFLFKLDAVLLTLASLGYFIKNLDQSNLTNAYVSGMKEDLNMVGNEYNTAVSLWTVGYVIGQVPSNLLLTRISPRLWIPFVELGWSIFTLATYRIKNVQQLYAMRFFVGLFESAFYPGMQYIMGSWYRPDELGKRAVIFHTAGGIGSLFSGFLQAAAYDNLGGVNGLSGWRWLMIICFVISVPIAIANFIFLLDMPWKAKANWMFSEEEILLANARLRKEGRAPAQKITWAKIRRIASSWHVWVLPWLYVFWNNSGGMGDIMIFWLKSFNKKGQPPVYTVSQINLYVLPKTGVYIIFAWIMAWISDGALRGRRWPLMVFGSTFSACLGIAILSIPLYSHRAAHFVLYYFTGLGVGLSGLHFAWASEICTKDTEERSLVIALMNDLAYVFQAWVPLLVWKQTEMPKATKGIIFTIVLCFTHVFWTLLVLFLHTREKRRVAGLAISQGGLESSPSPPSPILEDEKVHPRDLDEAGEEVGQKRLDI